MQVLLVVALLLACAGAARPRAAVATGCATPRDVSALAAASSTLLFAGTSDGGLYRSTDAGHCWLRLGSYPPGIQIGTLLALPGARPVVIAGGSFLVSTAQRSWTLYRSVDGGRTWTSALNGLPRTQIVPVQISVATSGTLVLSYLCPRDQESFGSKPLCVKGLARSADAGASWRPVGPPATVERGVVALSGGAFLALERPARAGNSADSHLYRSPDDGRTWHDVGALRSGTGAAGQINGGGIGAFFAVPWDSRQILAGGDVQYLQPVVYRSLDGGAHWSSSPWHPARSRGLFTEPFVAAFAALTTSHTLLLSDWGAIYRSTDGGAHWTRATGLPVLADGSRTRIWMLLATPDGATAYAATALGVYRSVDDGRMWQRA